MTDTFETEDSRTDIAALLSASYHFMIGRIIDELDAAGYGDLSKTQLHLLSRVEMDGMSIDGLARRVHMPPQIVSNLVQMLAENGYLSAEQNLNDIRATIMHLADRGRDAREIVEASQQNVERDWANTLGVDSYAQLREGLRQLFAASTHTHPSAP